MDAPRPRIERALSKIAVEEDVAIVYACESGSRAWGFESADSDYDVRFLYVHPAAWYLGIKPGRDVIERPPVGDLDISGWDLRKALQLYRKSNPPLLEWLQSPIVYQDATASVSQLKALAPRYHSPAASHYHYLHMAQGNYRQYLRDEAVWLKKYLYVLRPVLACLWIEQGFGAVPMVFADLIDGVVKSRRLRAAIDRLLAQKKAGRELGYAPRMPVLSEFLDTEITRLAGLHPEPGACAPPIAVLDDLFQFAIIDAYGENIRQDTPHLIAATGDRARVAYTEAELDHLFASNKETT